MTSDENTEVVNKTALENKIQSGYLRQALNKFNGCQTFSDEEISYIIEMYEAEVKQSMAVCMIVPSECTFTRFIEEIQRLNPGLDIGTDGNYGDPSGNTYSIIVGKKPVI